MTLTWRCDECGRVVVATAGSIPATWRFTLTGPDFCSAKCEQEYKTTRLTTPPVEEEARQ